MNRLRRYTKAVTAFLTTLAGGITTVFADGKVQAPEVMVAIITIIVATFGVYQLPNDPPAGQLPDPNVSERGHSDVSLLVWLLVTMVISVIVTVTVIAVWNVPHG